MAEMSVAARAELDEQAALPQLRELADRMFSRAAGAPLVNGNQVRLLEDGRENYPAWLAAIRAAKDHVPAAYRCGCRYRWKSPLDSG